MRRDDPPSIRGAYQRLGFAAGGRFAVALVFGVGGREVAAVGGDDGVEQRPAKWAEFAAAAEIRDRLPALQVLADAVARRGGMIPEQLFHDRDIAALQRGFIAIEHRANFGNDVRQIDEIGHVAIPVRRGSVKLFAWTFETFRVDFLSIFNE